MRVSELSWIARVLLQAQDEIYQGRDGLVRVSEGDSVPELGASRKLGCVVCHLVQSRALRRATISDQARPG